MEEEQLEVVMVMVESMEKQEEQSKLCQKNQFNIYIQTKKKHIQDEEQHIEQKFPQMAEEQQEVVLVE